MSGKFSVWTRKELADLQLTELSLQKSIWTEVLFLSIKNSQNVFQASREANNALAAYKKQFIKKTK